MTLGRIKVSPKAFQSLLARDEGRCVHCGETEALSPNHRANRGMGGSKARERASNYVLLCSAMNSLIESNAEARHQALVYGWKINSWDDPLDIPVYDRLKGSWFALDDDFRRVEL